MSGPNPKKAKVAAEFDPREDASSSSSNEEEYFSAEEEPAAGPSTLLQSIEPVPDAGPPPSPVSETGSESQAMEEWWETTGREEWRRDMARRQRRVRFSEDTKQEDGEGSRAYRRRVKAQRRTIQ